MKMTINLRKCFRMPLRVLVDSGIRSAAKKADDNANRKIGKCPALQFSLLR